MMTQPKCFKKCKLNDKAIMSQSSLIIYTKYIFRCHHVTCQDSYYTVHRITHTVYVSCCLKMECPQGTFLYGYIVRGHIKKNWTWLSKKALTSAKTKLVLPLTFVLGTVLWWDFIFHLDYKSSRKRQDVSVVSSKK